MRNYAKTLENQGKLNEAAEIQEEVLEKSTRILGAEHPHTMLAMSDYAITFGYQGKLDKAVEIMKEVLEKRTKILGAEHPSTKAVATNLSILNETRAFHQTPLDTEKSTKRSIFQSL